MKNITLAIDEDTLAEVRKYAAANNTTVNALVREYLSRLAHFESSSKKAREELLKLAEKSTLSLGDWKWNREELYDRYELSRHKHSSLPGFPGASERDQKGDSSEDH